jgi:hypothetical protein
MTRGPPWRCAVPKPRTRPEAPGSMPPSGSVRHGCVVRPPHPEPVRLPPLDPPHPVLMGRPPRRPPTRPRSTEQSELLRRFLVDIRGKCRARHRPARSALPFCRVARVCRVTRAGPRVNDGALDEFTSGGAGHAGLKSGVVHAAFAKPRQQPITRGVRHQINARHVLPPLSPFHRSR